MKVPSFLRANRRMWSVMRILLKEYGMAKSFATKHAVDSEGNPIPWYPYPALEYINQCDWSSKVIFEYGSGIPPCFGRCALGRYFQLITTKSGIHSSRIKDSITSN